MISIAVAGLGNVGAEVVRLLQKNADIIAARAGQAVTVKAVAARDRQKKRHCDLTDITWVDNPHDLATLPGVDIVIELMGGADGPAYDLAKATLASGKKLVTANKALLASHGAELAMLADKNNSCVAFEAAVAGGIPVIKVLREGLAANRVTMIRGILNGTCNYILSRMREDQLSFADALREAQQHGYAEADPTSDIGGHDTANKLALLAALAFGTAPNVAAIDLEGITRISPLDLQFATELNCRIKLLGVARVTAEGVESRVGPSLVPFSSPLAHVRGALNAIMLRGDFVGDLMLEGQGAGSMPTASAVVGDIIDLVRGIKIPMFGVAAHQLKALTALVPPQEARYYMRLQALDKPGVVADISSILRDEAISIASLIQHGTSATQSVPVVLTTHHAKAEAMKRAVHKIAELSTIVERPCLIHIED